VKLLVLCERVDGEGGTETYLRTLLPALVARGDSVRVVARSVNEPGAYGVPDETVAWADEHDQPDADAGRRIARIARAFDASAIVAHNVLDAAVLEAARDHAQRFIYHLHDHRPFCPNGDRLFPQGGEICTAVMGGACAWHALANGCAYGPRPRTLGLIGRRQRVRAAIVTADATISLSRYVDAIAQRHGIAAQRAHVVAPPLDDAAFAPSPVARPARDAVLFAGRLMPSKGARSLVRALARIDVGRRPLLRIAGDGPDLVATLNEAEQRGVALESLGRLGPERLRDAFDQATLVAVPSLWAEPFGLAGIEAFARARPVLAYAVGGIPEWIGTGGTAVARGDEAGLAEAIVALLDATAWQRAALAAFSAAQSYRIETHVDALRTIYRG
jgi:glycosyltransferase involved in cell wall biosynthesis